MKTTLTRWMAIAVVVSCFAGGVIRAQEPATADSAKSAAAQSQAAQPQSGNPNTDIGNDLATASKEAADSAEHEADEENAKFKYSPAVRWLGRHVNADPHRAYAISLIVNFGLLGLFFYMLLKSKLPQAFRDRTASIQKSIREAEAASADAAQRLSRVEARLAKLDAEVANMRTEAERNAAEEEQRILAAAEEDKKRIVDSAEAEISSIARNARRELKSYAASLAVDLAARNIHVDEGTDHALVREFVDQFGKGGK